MDPESAPSVTSLLRAWSAGDPEAERRLVPLVYGELRRRAGAYLRRERPGHTLQPTALVHEAWLRLAGQDVDWRNRSQFFGMASQLMRRILVDHARRRRAARRGGGLQVPLEEAMGAPAEGDRVDLIRLDEALTELAELDPRQGRIVELRFFGGLTTEETAGLLQVSPATIKRDWTVAKAWLLDRLREG
jgi:RNA polymerase sigma factor (TIGR02999 family)